MTSVEKTDKILLANTLFQKGYNCAQAVAGAFCQEMGLPLDTVTRLASGFGGGIGGRRETCGAVSGMVMVYSALCGYDDPEAKEEKQDVYTQIKQVTQLFEETYQTIQCADLIVRGADSQEGRPCTCYVERCTEILCDFL